MGTKRHKRDTSTYRGLANYGERVKSFNMTALLLREYVRVQVEEDAKSGRTARDIVGKRIKTLEKTTAAIRKMAK